MADQDHLYKILVVGEFGVGKTSLIRRYTEGVFSPHYKLTIGVDFALKTLSIGDYNPKKVHLQLWDIAGHERFGFMTRVYYKYAIAAICVFDLSRPATFDAVNKWIDDINSVVVLADGQPIPIILLANKCDISDVELDEPSVDAFCRVRNLIGWFRVSAKDNVGIEPALTFLVKHLLTLTNSPKRPSSSELTPLVDLTEDDDNNNTDSRALKRGQKVGCCS